MSFECAQVAAEPALWWGEALFLGDAKIRNEVVDAAEAIGSGQSAPSLGTLMSAPPSLPIPWPPFFSSAYMHSCLLLAPTGAGAHLGACSRLLTLTNVNTSKAVGMTRSRPEKLTGRRAVDVVGLLSWCACH